MCSLLSIERSGYYAWLNKKPGKREEANKLLDVQIKAVFNQHQSRYGSPRLTDELKDSGESCSKNRVAKRLKALGLRAKGKKKFRHTTDSNHHLPIAPNVLNRAFKAQAPNLKWCGDITYIWTAEGWLYLATVIDLYSRKIIGWSLQSTMHKQLVMDAMEMALNRRDFPKGVLFHSDRGSQYCSEDYQKLLKLYGLESSMSRKGNCWDNAVAESFFHSIKTELICHERYLTRDSAKESIFQYIEVYYNRLRRHSTIGSISPERFESQYGKLA
jgi:putative transposase